MRLRFVLGALLVCVNATVVLAEVQTFNVDLFGTDRFSNHTLRVFGTLTVDDTKPVMPANIISALQFQHNQDPVFDFPSTPNFTLGDPSLNLEWHLDGRDLYINRLSDIRSQIFWISDVSSPPHGEFSLESGGGHRLHYIDAEDPGLAILKPETGPDGPKGFLVGTTAIPEPSAAMLLAGLGAAFCLRRRRR